MMATMTIAPPTLYLGPNTPRWQPRTLADVQQLIDSGGLAEGHWLDGKAEFPATRDLARHLASFANDGGVLVIGVAEDKPRRTFSLEPISLAGKAEMVDQVARSLADPPIFVRCHPIPDPTDGTRGVLVIEVPASPLAPHMVGGRYYGRGDTTKHVLADPEVEQRHAVRRARQVGFAELIDQEAARDPLTLGAEGSVDHRGRPRLHMVARPLASPPELLTAHLPTAVAPVIKAAETRPYLSYGRWPLLDQREARATGFGWHSGVYRSRRIEAPNTYGRREGLIDLEVWDDATLTLLAGDLEVELATTVVTQDTKDLTAVHTDMVVGLVCCMTALAGKIGAEFGYAGQWQLALGLTGVGGRPGFPTGRETRVADPLAWTTFSADQHVAGTLASTTELNAAAGAVARRLLMRYVRGLDVLSFYDKDSYFGALPDPMLSTDATSS